MTIMRDRPRFPDGHNASGEVLFDDTFASGLGLWRDHVSAAVPTAPISLSTMRSWEGSPYSMLLSTSPRRNSGTIPAATCSTYRNMSRDFDTGKVRFEAWVATGWPLQNDPDTGNTPNSWFIGVDTQTWDNSSRGFYRLTAQIRTGPDQTSVLSNAWRLNADNGDQVYISRTGAGSTAVPAQSPPMPGENEFKLNFFRVALWVDLTAVRSTDGAPGSYFRAEMGNRVYDLTGLVDGAGNPIGRGKQTPQTGSSVGGGSFAGGFNFGVGLANRTTTDIAYPPILLVGRARGTWYPDGVSV